VLLHLAAHYIERHGYHQPCSARDNYGTAVHSEPAASVEGAIARLIYGYPVPMPAPDGSPAFVLLRSTINAYVDQLEQVDPTGVWEPSTADGVVAQLRAAAALWMDRHAVGGAA
jgi:hypothetical protein